MSSSNHCRKQCRMGQPNNGMEPTRRSARLKRGVSAPSEAWRFLWGGSPHRGRSRQPPVPRVACVEEVEHHRTKHTKRTQGTMEATREGARPGSLGQPREGNKADGDGFHAPEANTTASFSGEMLEGLSGSSGRGMHGEKRRERGRPGRFRHRKGAGKSLRPHEGRLKTFRESEQLTGRRDTHVEVRRKGLTA